MYVVQDHGPGSNSCTVLKVEDGSATYVCTVNAGNNTRNAPPAWGGAIEQQDNPALAIARILTIELERRDAMK